MTAASCPGTLPKNPLLSLQRQKGEAVESPQISWSGHAVGSPRGAVADAAAWQPPRRPPVLCVHGKGGTILDAKDLQPWQTVVTGDTAVGNLECSLRPSLAGDRTPRRSREPKALTREPQALTRGPKGAAGGQARSVPSPGAPEPGMGFSLDREGRKAVLCSSPPSEAAKGQWDACGSAACAGGSRTGGPLTKAGRSCCQEGPDPKRCLPGAALPYPKARVSHTER